MAQAAINFQKVQPDRRAIDVRRAQVLFSERMNLLGFMPDDDGYRKAAENVVGLIFSTADEREQERIVELLLR
jgi:hypothetical protein